MSEVIEGTVVQAPAFSRPEERALPTVQQQSVAGNATSLLVAIERATSNPAMDIDKMERLFAMHQKVVAQEAEAAFNAAMARAQARIVPVVNNATNTHTSSKYAKLAAINKAITPIYGAEGLSVSFDTDRPIIGPDGVTLLPAPAAGLKRTVAIVSHSQGHSRMHHIDLELDDAGSAGKTNKTAVQAMGSTSSYGRRYLVCMIFNVTTEDDDDGNGSHGKDRPTMDEGALVDHIAAMDECADLPSLQKAFGVAYKAAQAVPDKGAMGVLTRAKDARKAALTAKAGAK